MARQMELRPAAQGLNELERHWRQPLYALLAMGALLLLIACANLANLLMARSVARSREIAIRLALGAGRTRVVRLLLVESLLMALPGALCGLLVAPALTGGILRLMPADAVGGWLTVTISRPLLGFSSVLMLLAMLLFGLAPALSSTRSNGTPLSSLMQATATARVQGRSRKALVAGQVALCLVLLCAAGLFGRSLINLMRYQPGFRADHLLTFSIDAGLSGYSTERGLTFYRELTGQLAALPGVESVAMAFSGPLSHSDTTTNVSVEGFTPREDEDMDCDTNAVSPGWFRTLGTPFLEGREFDERDRQGAPRVAIVNETFARRFFAGHSAVGQHMKIGAGGPLDIEIVGLVADAKHRSLREVVRPTYYIPYEQSLGKASLIRRGSFFLRASVGFEALPGLAQATVAQMDATLPVFALKTMEVQVAESVYTDRLIVALSTAFGILATLLTAVGLYGVIAYMVSRRTAEIGIRMALGAPISSVLLLVLREGVVLTLIGLCAGLPFVFAASGLISHMLFGVRRADPLTFGASGLMLVVVALAACYFPAQRATKIDPVAALRHE